MSTKSFVKRHPLASSLALAAAIATAPVLTFADDHRDHRRGWDIPQSDQNYSQDELRILAEAHALKRFGPGSTATITKNEDRGTFVIEIRDADNNVLRENEVNVYGRDIRAPRAPKGD